MTGYFRDDGPLYELMLDERGRRELDRLWREFDFITGAPMRQYSSYLWFERAETGFLRGRRGVRLRPRRGQGRRVRGQDGPVRGGLPGEGPRGSGRARQAIRAIEDQFRIIAETIRRVEQEHREAEPRHVEALQRFAERAYRRPL